MAAADAIGTVQFLHELPVADSARATFDKLTGASTPSETFTVYDFDASADEYIDWLCRLHGYSSGGLTFKLFWSASSATSGNVVWSMGIRRLAAFIGSEDFDTTSHTYLPNSIVVAAPSAVGELSYDTITFTNGADMDSWANSELAIVRLFRRATSGADNMSGDAELWGVIGYETGT